MTEPDTPAPAQAFAPAQAPASHDARGVHAAVAPHRHDTSHLDREFGAISGAEVRFHERSDSEHSSVQERRAQAKAGGRYSRAQLLRLRDLLFHKRWLRQMFKEEGVLVREVHRKQSNEELYLDLIVVAALASLSHELRHNFNGWESVENFILLFGALFSSWRMVMYLWNSFGTKGDLVDKVGIFFTQVQMAGIGLGAHSAFTNARIPVAIASFLATAVPAASFTLMSWREPAAKNEHNIFHQGIWHGLTVIATTLPYLAAAFVKSERGAKNCYWAGLALSQSFVMSYVLVYMLLHRNRPKAVRYAINVESMVEKYGTLALIVLGESLMAMLFEGSELLASEGVKVGALFAGVFEGVLIVYSVQTLYFNVDNYLVKGAVHPIRHNKWNGIAWAQLHFLYFLALGGLLSTGIGIMLRDIAIPPTADAAAKASAVKDTADHMLALALRASGENVTGVAQFNDKARWLFSGAWMTVMLSSSLMGLFYLAGPRGRTKNQRLVGRIVIALALGIGIPFTNVTASQNLTIFACTSVLFALSEFILVQMDRVGMLSWSGVPIPSSAGSSTDVEPLTTESGDFDSDEMGEEDDLEAGKTAGKVDNDDDADDEVDAATAAARHAAAERQQRHRRRFEAISHPVLALRHATHHV